MQLEGLHLVFFALGIVLGCFVAWIFLRGRIALSEANGRAAGAIELTQIREQLKASQNEAQSLRADAISAGKKLDELTEEASRAASSEALLQERASRIPLIEKDLAAARAEADGLEIRLRAMSEQLGAASSRFASADARVIALESEKADALEAQETLRRELAAQSTAVTKLTQELVAERAGAQEKLTLLEQARQTLSDQFKALASEILDEKSRKFTEQNHVNLGQLLTPLREQLSEFKTKVEEVYVNEGKDRSALVEQVRQLMSLNQTLSQDANNLALAIRGDRKAQGNWGEIILEELLERAGLIAGQHYDRQTGLKGENNLSNVIPDIVIRLPGERHLVVDSKLTLPDYRAFADAETADEKAAAMKRHLLSIRNHIKGLSEKNYQNLYDLKSLDFVVMFVPLEPAFMLAVTHDSELFQQAWERNVLLVSPSTLLFVVRTVAYLWRQEGLSRNAKEISTRGAELYDKLVGFMVDLDRVGERLRQAQDSYGEARKKLHEGKGNVIRQAELLKQLGVKPAKSLPADLIQMAGEADTDRSASIGSPDTE